MYDYKNLLNPNERVFFFGGVHFIVMANSFLFFFIACFAGFSMMKYIGTDSFTNTGPQMTATPPAITPIEEEIAESVSTVADLFTYALNILPWLFIVGGILWVIKDTIHYLTTKVMLTSHRLVIKKGWIMVRINEVELEEIKAARVNQGTFGRFLGYGKVMLDARFVADYVLPVLKKPFDLVKLIHVLRDHDIGAEKETAEPVDDEVPFKTPNPNDKVHKNIDAELANAHQKSIRDKIKDDDIQESGTPRKKTPLTKENCPPGLEFLLD